MIIKKGLTKILVAVREVVDSLSKDYVEYEYGSLKEDKKDYKYKKDTIEDIQNWEEILKGNDYY
jgi:hypothetical protein